MVATEDDREIHMVGGPASGRSRLEKYEVRETMKAKDVEVGMVATLNSESHVGMTVVKFYQKPPESTWLVDMLWLDTELKPHMLAEISIDAIQPYVPQQAAA
jgi:hypothetical protein